MNSGWKLILRLAYVAIGLALLMLPTGAYAHGARVEYIGSTAIEIVAKYDNGEPMGGAQVVVYAPDDPSTPWLTGTCDSEGRFTFRCARQVMATWFTSQSRMAWLAAVVPAATVLLRLC